MNLIKEKIINSFVWKHRDALLLFFCVVFICLQIFNKAKIQTIITTDPLQVKQLEKYKDESGKIYAKMEQAVLDKVTAEKYSDSLAKALKIKPKFIKGVDRVIVRDSIIYRTDHSTPVVTSKGDTAYKVEYHDAWSDIVAVAGKDTGTIKQVQRDTVTRVEIVEGGSGIFSKPIRHTIFLGNANPHVDIFEGASFTVQEKKVWLTVGPYIGYDIFHGVSLGVSAQLPIFQFKR